MKNLKITIISILLFLTSCETVTQQVTISPIPQSIEWKKQKAFDNTAKFKLIDKSTLDNDVVNLLKANLKIADLGVDFIIGEKNDNHLTEYKSLVPNEKGGYYLKIEKNRVIIVGNDEKGTFYGVQTFLQLMKSPKVMQVEIKDYPDMPNRGAIEGFYGNPWSHQDRLRLFEFMGKNKMDIYVYSPKDDPYHKDRWAEPYPTEKGEQIKELVENARKNKVKFVWAIHIGGKGVTNEKEYQKLINKFEKMYELGVRDFAMFYDDFGNETASQQCKTTNYVVQNFLEKKTDVGNMLFCPTGYNKAWASKEYLTTLGKEMDKSVMIYWTGNSVVDMINYDDMVYINNFIKRKAFIWLNYPVTDYCIEHLLMGKTYGNDKNIGNMVSGFTSNPMEYCEASQLSLYSIADYSWNTEDYDAEKSWLRAIRYLQPNNYEAFKIFCENNVDLGVTGHKLRRADESKAFRQDTDDFLSQLEQKKVSKKERKAIKKHFQSFINSSDKLLKSNDNRPLIDEISPWLNVFKIMGQKGLLLMDMTEDLEKKDSVRFIKNYLAVKDLNDRQKQIRSRNFKGSIKSPNPEPANEVVAPFLKKLQAQLISNYKQNYAYKKDVFPTYLLEDGKYYIKHKSNYLTNSFQQKGYPIFVNKRDTINPQRQEWNIAIDANSERYSIINAQDKRYVNELGNFGRNPYSELWNSYLIFRKNGKYTIQNAGSSGDKVWEIQQNRIQRSNHNQPNTNDYIFEIIPINNKNSHK
ncbi:MAG: beta-N-acetylglucosaminidase domain-containing protein [Flavobacteriaceae bacterium]|nr:beta-N-acetylglucosaminidase domain-containing protein [Flavobacteriaceae bacterium]